MRVFAQNRSSVKLVAGLLLLAGVLVAGWLLWGSYIGNRQRQIVYQASFPGSADQRAEFMVPGRTPDNLAESLTRLLQTDSGFASLYIQAGKANEPPARRSDRFLAGDQILYGRYLLEQGQKGAFLEWWSFFAGNWQGADGLFGDQTKADEDWLRDNLSVARLLVQSLNLWPDEKRAAQLKDLSDGLLARLTDDGLSDNLADLPALETVLDPGATPAPKPATPSPAGQNSTLSVPVVRLASLDLLAISLLRQVDARWDGWFSYFKTVVEEGFLDGPLPIYAWAWDAKQQKYLPFAGDTPLLDSEELALTVLHLCEIEKAPGPSINWLRDQLFNQGAIANSYHPVQGTVIEDEESLVCYALTARIARIISDESLYQAATNRLLWHQATSKTSSVLNAIFRLNEDQEVVILARDNLWALLALR